MFHKNMLALLGVLACLSAGVLSAETSRWQALNPNLGEPNRADLDAAQEEFNDTPYDVTYPEGHNETESEFQEQDDMMAELPFKIPFKMDKKQTAVAMKLLKEAVKPILKSKRLQDFVAYLDDSIAGYRSDLETQMYVTLILDSLQEIYEGKETSELNMILKRFFKNISDNEETARTLDSVWSSYVSPVLNSYIYNPMRNYVVAPVRSYIYEPISNYVFDFAERIENWMESSRRPYIDIQYPEYSRWSQTFNEFTNRISDWTEQAREGLSVARRMLELQDEARGCFDCNEQQHMDSQELYAIQH